MFAITGITGQVGGQIAEALLAAKRPVRAVLRDKAKAWRWIERGCEAAIAAMDDAAALTAAFTGAEAAFVLLPPVFDPASGFAESRRNIGAISAALRASGVPRVVVLSTIGAEAAPENLLTQLQLLEQALADLPAAVTFLRAAWFVENVAWDIEGARKSGTMPSFLQPVDRPIAMVATADVARAAAALLLESSEGHRVVELEGPARVSPAALASALGQALGREVVAQTVPRADWEALLRAQGMRNPVPRMRMIDGFNEGWIDFGAGARKGTTPLQAVVDGLVRRGTP
ncbi:NAD(P)H-binding protein [Scleromatobacter humisilvae]|uniref:NAD(P)H-binding protein n=1 Tax=Scleromatobacter humisilvae TaxID=2897159 RepID=A0A9X2BYE6_9BURK|nr:NAD(P)H-binding protein [Scleromatobacter humisilvae]MCK9684091.1 NAD(P)H-binding protein [Scleromatobacter humisilvae]